MHARSLRILVVLAAPGVAFPADAATRALAAAPVAGAERHHVGSEAVKKAIDSAPEGAAVDALISACRKAATEAGAGSRAASILTAAIESAGTQDGAEAAATLRGALKRVRAMVSFQPVFESDRPTDFPSLTPVGTIQVKSYPVHRAATARSPAEGGLPRNLLFWQLFGHIKKNDIAMTAPVVMDYARDDGAGTAMSFLYASSDIGKTGFVPPECQ